MNSNNFSQHETRGRGSNCADLSMIFHLFEPKNISGKSLNTQKSPLVMVKSYSPLLYSEIFLSFLACTFLHLWHWHLPCTMWYPRVQWKDTLLFFFSVWISEKCCFWFFDFFERLARSMWLVVASGSWCDMWVIENLQKMIQNCKFEVIIFFCWECH